MSQIQMNTTTVFNKSHWKHVGRLLYKSRHLYLMGLPVVLYFLIFQYVPMYGIIIAFKEYKPFLGILGSKWVGLTYFQDFFSSYYFWRLLRNTLLINIYEVVFHFPAPIILALLLNEIRSTAYKRLIQTVTYLPHFISMVVIAGFIYDFFSTQGLVNTIIIAFGGNPHRFLGSPSWFRTLFVGSGIWQQVGWGSIIYLSALTSIDTEQYEAAIVDGAGRWKQLIHITIPGIIPTIVILLILRFGQMMNVGFEKVLLLQTTANIETSDVISTFVYRRGILEGNFSYSSAVGLFNSVINFILIIVVNSISKKVSETSLW